MKHKCSKAAAAPPRPIEDAESDFSDDEDDSDLENAAMLLEDADEVEQEAEDQSRFCKQGFASGSDAAMPPEGVLIHKVYRTAHRSTDECEAACGVTVRELMFEYTLDQLDLYDCKLCWRAGCPPWLPMQTESAAGSDEEGPMNSIDPSLFEAFAPASPPTTPACAPDDGF